MYYLLGNYKDKVYIRLYYIRYKDILVTQIRCIAFLVMNIAFSCVIMVIGSIPSTWDETTLEIRDGESMLFK